MTIVNKTNTFALQVDELRKSFRTVDAVKGVTFQLRDGERLALLGPNGAGKTTLIRCLSGRCRPNSGSIRLHGQPIEGTGVRDSLGLVPQEIALYQDLTTRENLKAFAKFHRVAKTAIKDRIDWALQWTGLEDRADHLVGGFSGGMKRRVNLACGVLHSPSVLLLDEPTVGVDPQSRERIFSMLDELNKAGTSILLTTHHLDEAQQRSDRIVIVDHGQIVADGTIGQLIKQTVGDSRLVRVRIDRPVNQCKILKDRRFKLCDDRTVQTRIDDVSDQLGIVLHAVKNSGCEVSDVEVHAPSLHHVFLHLTGHELRDE